MKSAGAFHEKGMLFMESVPFSLWALGLSPSIGLSMYERPKKITLSTL